MGTALLWLILTGWAAAIAFDVHDARRNGDGREFPNFTGRHCLVVATAAVVASHVGLEEFMPTHLAWLLGALTALPAGAAWLSLIAKVVRLREPLWKGITAAGLYWSQSAVFYFTGTVAATRGDERFVIGLSSWVCWSAAVICMLLGFREKSLSKS